MEGKGRRTDEPVADAPELDAAVELLVAKHLARHRLRAEVALVDRHRTVRPGLDDAWAEAPCELLCVLGSGETGFEGVWDDGRAQVVRNRRYEQG